MFLYYLAAIGSPNIEEKTQILLDNLNYLYKQIKTSFDIIINCYDEDDETLEKQLKDLSFLRNVYFYRKKGRLVELWKTNPYHLYIQNYLYILFILDDVKFEQFNLLELISIKSIYQIEFLSPKVIGGTWDYMRNQPYNTLALANNIELFCLLLSPKDFTKFIEINDIENTHTWGVDYLLGHFQIKSAICFTNSVFHCLSSNTNCGLAGQQMHDYLRKHGYETVEEIVKKYPPIYKLITL
jgi:hypothetical protein